MGGGKAYWAERRKGGRMNIRSPIRLVCDSRTGVDLTRPPPKRCPLRLAKVGDEVYAIEGTITEIYAGNPMQHGCRRRWRHLPGRAGATPRRPCALAPRRRPRGLRCGPGHRRSSRDHFELRAAYASLSVEPPRCLSGRVPTDAGCEALRLELLQPIEQRAPALQLRARSTPIRWSRRFTS